MQTNDFSNLPTSWQIKTLGEVCVFTNANITLKHTRQKGYFAQRIGFGVKACE